MATDRRRFVKQISAGAAMIAIPAAITGIKDQYAFPEIIQAVRVSRLDKPVAIAMWDFSWILRHHRYGEFENWDNVLEGLAERGYNAIRIDAMPQFVAADSSGKIETEFRSVKNGWQPSLWGNDFTMSFRPREALLEFLPKCHKSGIKVGKNATPQQQKFYNDFISSVTKILKGKYPGMDFFASLDSSMELDRIDLSEFDALDYHIWFAHTGKVPGLDKVGARDQSQDYREIYSGLKAYWKENRESLVKWMDGRIGDISGAAAKHNIVCGNTEGWGPISWFDHPELDWEWVKESAEICIDLARKHNNYKFICTSNFTHPQFRGIWDDIKWHQKITEKIKA
jgi:hypothetical protein